MLEGKSRKTSLDVLCERLQKEAHSEPQCWSASTRVIGLGNLECIFLEGARSSSFEYSDKSFGNENAGRIVMRKLGGMGHWSI